MTFMRVFFIVQLIFFVSFCSFAQDGKETTNTNWDVILTKKKSLFRKKHCFVKLEDALKKQTTWSKDLSQLFDATLASAIAGDVQSYEKFFKRNKPLDEKEILQEMAEWRAYNSIFKLHKFVWAKKDSTYALVVVEGDYDLSNYPTAIKIKNSYRMKSFQRIFMIEKNKENYYFLPKQKDEILNQLIKKELYTSLDPFHFKISINDRRLRKKELQKKEKKEDYRRWLRNVMRDYYMKRFKEHGYSKKDIFKLYIDIQKYNKRMRRYADYTIPNAMSLQFKYGLTLGTVKFFLKPILFKDTFNKVTSLEDTALIRLRKQLYQGVLSAKEHYAEYKMAFVVQRSNDFQLFGYEKKVFRGKVYYYFFGTSYSLKKETDELKCQYLELFFNKKNRWRKLNEIDDFIFAQLIPFAYKIQNVISGRPSELSIMKHSIYNKRLKNTSLYEYFRLKKEEECTLFNENLDVLKLPTYSSEFFEKSFPNIRPLPKLELEHGYMFLSREFKKYPYFSGWDFRVDEEDDRILERIVYQKSSEVDLYVTRDKADKTQLNLYSNRKDIGFLLKSDAQSLQDLFYAPKGGYKQKISFKIDLQNPKNSTFFAYLKLAGTYGKVKIKAILKDKSLDKNYDVKKDGLPYIRYALEMRYYYNASGSQNIATKLGDISGKRIIKPELD